ncbi:unnamed protein product [Prorocentrum cordatum]|uniref:Ubiquitinyl hydrolase 1 n=1 Tax=Prorocentrum cordatum TaxID=2364126 RepID=A0ABN9PYT6_9DINO|nr:unnamed protein product [Polarella glacialis]
MWQGAVRRHDPEALQQRLAELAPHLLAGGEQQDVQEFLSFFIDGLHADLDRVASPPPPLSEEDERRDARLAEERGEEWTAALAWMRHLERSKSFLVDLLQGQVRSTLRCTRCGHKSRCFDPFLYLSVPVARSTHTLDDAIRLYLDEELLTGGDRWRCPKCETLVDATKKIDLWKLPPVLVLHLKRFEFDRRSLQIRKVDHRVDVPLELNLLEHCSSSQKEGAVYELACVANHRGAFGGGHYTATCRVGEGPERQWYCFDDERVFPLPAGRQVVTEEAYVVFFELRPSSRPREGAAAGRRAPARQSLASPQDWPHQIVRMRTLQSAARARAGAPGAGPPPPGPRGAAPSAQAAGAAAAAEPREPRSGRAAEEAKGRGAEPAPPGPLGEPSLSGARGCEGGADGGGLLGAWVPPLFGARGCEDDAEGGGLLGAWLHTREPSEGSPWVRRWCVLHRDALRFSVDSGGVEEAGEIALGEEVAMERLEGGSCSAPRGAPYTFLLHPGGPAQAPCMLAAEDGETFRAWRVAVENLAGRGGAARNDEVCCAAS